MFAIAGSQFPLPSLELPLGDVQDIAVDNDGNILLALLAGRCPRWLVHGCLSEWRRRGELCQSTRIYRAIRPKWQAFE